MSNSTIPNRSCPLQRSRPRPHRLRHRRLPALLLFAALGLALNISALAQRSTLAPPPPPPLPPPTQPASPAVIARVTAAKTLFLSNAGANDSFALTIPGPPNLTYNEFYAALQQWGYFRLVDSPAHADLILQIRSTELAPSLVPTIDSQHIVAQQHAPTFVLTLLDPHDPATPLDTITTLAGRGTNLSKGAIAFAQSIEWLTYQFSTRVSAPRSDPGKLLDRNALRPSFETLIDATGPVPPQVLHAKSVYILSDPPAPNAKPDPYLDGFTSALNQWEHYTLTDTPASADLLFHFHNTEADGIWLTLEDPTTHLILWTLTDPHHGFYRQDGKRRVAALTQNLLAELKLLNHIPLTQAETAALH